MPHHHMQHAQNVGPNVFACNENSAYVIPHATTHAVTSCTHRAVHTCRQASHPYLYVVNHKLLIDMPFMPAEYIYQN